MVDVISSNGWLNPALAAMEMSQMVSQVGGGGNPGSRTRSGSHPGSHPDLRCSFSPGSFARTRVRQRSGGLPAQRRVAGAAKSAEPLRACVRRCAAGMCTPALACPCIPHAPTGTARPAPAPFHLQALWQRDSVLMQLPHFTKELAAACNEKGECA